MGPAMMTRNEDLGGAVALCLAGKQEGSGGGGGPVYSVSKLGWSTRKKLHWCCGQCCCYKEEKKGKKEGQKEKALQGSWIATFHL